jgi:protein-L-isoaspartate(D-aspartate) O-methyltransferase
MQDYARARRAMIDSQLRPQGVTDPVVLAAFAEVPREEFVPEGARAFAYYDRSIPVDGGFMMPPAPLARLLTAAEPRAGERALVMSPAPGYAAAVLKAIGLQVEEVEASALGNASVEGPFDLILIEGAVEEVPAKLTDALAAGGRLVTALFTSGHVTRLAIGRKIAGVVGYTRFADSEIPVIPGFTRPPAFTF